MIQRNIARIVTFILLITAQGCAMAVEDYMIIGKAKLAGLSTSSPAYLEIKKQADSSWPAPDLCDQDVKHGRYVFAAALVFARTGVASYRDKVIDGINDAIPTQYDGCHNAVLSLGRQLGSYILAADLVGYRNSSFISWVSQIRTRNIGGHGHWYILRATADDSANNWGSWARASITAADIYVGDTTAVAHDVAVLKGFLGDRSAWAKFRGQKDAPITDDERSWACQPYSTSTFVPLNPACDSIRDGAIPADASRGGAYPNPGSDGLMYTREVLQGTFIQTELLGRVGFDLWSYQNNALKRAGNWLARFDGWNYGSISYGNAWLANKRLGTSYPTKTPTQGRMLVGYDWLWN